MPQVFQSAAKVYQHEPVAAQVENKRFDWKQKWREFENILSLLLNIFWGFGRGGLPIGGVAVT